MDMDTARLAVGENAMAIRFIPVANGNNEKMPKYRAAISLTGGLSGLVLEAPIFKDAKTGKFTVSMPGGRFSALKAEPQTIEHGGKTVLLADPDVEGQRKLE